MKNSARLALSLCVLFVLTLAGFTCSKQVPVNKPAAEETEEQPSESNNEN